MNWFVKFIHFFQAEMPLPQPWGAWHLVSLGLTILLSVVLGICLKNMGNKGLRIFLVSVSSLLIIIEIIKQCVYSLHIDNGVVTWDYVKRGLKLSQ